jgi:hypothetical protein
MGCVAKPNPGHEPRDPSASFTNQWPLDLSPCDTYTLEWSAGVDVSRPFSVRLTQSMEGSYPMILDTVSGPFPGGDCYVFQPQSSYIGSRISFELLDQHSILDSGSGINIKSCSRTGGDPHPSTTSPSPQDPPQTSTRRSSATAQPTPQDTTLSTGHPTNSASRSGASSNSASLTSSPSTPASSSSSDSETVNSQTLDSSGSLTISSASQTGLPTNEATVSSSIFPTATAQAPSDKHGLSVRAIVGIVLGLLALTVGLIFLSFCCRKRAKHRALGEERLHRVEPLEPFMVHHRGAAESSQDGLLGSAAEGKRGKRNLVPVQSTPRDPHGPFLATAKFNNSMNVDLQRPLSVGDPRARSIPALFATQNIPRVSDSGSIDEAAGNLPVSRRMYSSSDPGTGLDGTRDANLANQDVVQEQLEAQNEQLRREIALLRAMGRYSTHSSNPPYSPQNPPDYHTLESLRSSPLF